MTYNGKTLRSNKEYDLSKSNIKLFRRAVKTLIVVKLLREYDKGHDPRNWCVSTSTACLLIQGVIADANLSHWDLERYKDIVYPVARTFTAKLMKIDVGNLPNRCEWTLNELLETQWQQSPTQTIQD